MLAQKTQRRSAQFDEIQKRVNEFDTEKRVMEGKFYSEIQRVNHHAETSDSKVITLQDNMFQYVGIFIYV